MDNVDNRVGNRAVAVGVCDNSPTQCSPNSPGVSYSLEMLYENLHEIYETTKYINKKFRPIKEEEIVTNTIDGSIMPFLHESIKMANIIKDELRSIVEVL